jgi:hypothetical protein
MRSALLVFVAAACGHSSSTAPPAPGQSFHDAVQALCDLPDHVPDAAKPEDRLAGAGKWADEHVTNADARKLGDLGSLALDKEQLADAVKRANVMRCKLLDNGMSLQSYADAMKVLCAAPAGDRDNSAAYLRSHLLNPEVIRMVESLAELNPADASKRLHDAAARAAISDCPLLGKQ